MEEFDLEQLKAFNGRDGKPAYIALNGKVYEVSDSSLWEGGSHMESHLAGQDLTGEFPEAPHGLEVLERCPQVGVLKEAPVPEAGRDAASPFPIPRVLSRLIQRFPLLKRHPHPMVVHFPIVFMFSTAFFNLLYLLTGNRSFETTGLYCLAGGVLFTPAAILTGWLTWWLNYQGRPLRPVAIKKVLSFVMLGAALAALAWRLINPAVVDSLCGMKIFYFWLIFSLAPLAGAIGWFGGTLIFPPEK